MALGLSTLSLEQMVTQGLNEPGEMGKVCLSRSEVSRLRDEQVENGLRRG